MTGIRAKIDYILKHNVFLNKLFVFFVSIIFRFIGLFVRINNNAVLFSGHSRKYNDSPKAIYEYLISNPKYNKLIFYWALDDIDCDIPGKCIKIKTDTWRYFITSLKCKYWIACVNIERGLHYKKRKIVYLNTWHGTPLKTIGNSASKRKDYNFKDINYFCSSGEYESKIFLRDFKLRNSSIIYTGLPRNDELYNVREHEIYEIREKLDIPDGKKVILYAPTWRDSVDKGRSYSIKPPIDLEKWEKELGEEYVLLFRTHPYTNKLLGVQFNDFVRDYSCYQSINDLLKIADILISDYSATFFDYSILERPIICFGYDYDNYAVERGLYLDLNEEIPSGVIKTEDGILQKIKTMNYDAEAYKTKLFKNKYLEYGGNAVEICVRTIFGDMAK